MKSIVGLSGAYTLVLAPVASRLAPPELVAGLLLAIGLIALSVVDMRTFRLPDGLTLPLALAGIATAELLGWESWLERSVAALAGFAILYVVRETYYRLRGRHGLGLGDAKLFAAGGAWLGLLALPTTLLWACALALAWYGIQHVNGKQLSTDTRIPFGPFLAAGIWLVWLYGALVVDSALQ